MKVILLFALFGLSFGNDGDTECPVNPKADDPNCLIRALTELSYFLPAVAKYVCTYSRFTEDNNIDNYNAGAEIFFNILKCTGCHFDDLLTKGYTIEDILVKAGETGSEALKVVIEILKLLGLDEFKAKLICTLAGKLLASDCLKLALGTIAPNILVDLKKLYCELDNKGAVDAADDLVHILEALGCALEQGLGLQPGELKHILTFADHDSLKDLIGKLLLLTKEVKVLNQTLCTLINPLDGTGLLRV